MRERTWHSCTLGVYDDATGNEVMPVKLLYATHSL